MKLRHGIHLAYCTNIHRGETWSATLAALEKHALDVRRQVAPEVPFAIGLRLGAEAARELAEPAVLAAFRNWLDQHGCYVFTINGFPYGPFHGTAVKEQVYRPDWTTEERLEYTILLFRILSQLVPPGVAGSVSTVPASFKAFIHHPGQLTAIRRQLWRAVEAIDELCQQTGQDLHLGLEPEPLCTVETTAETVALFDALRRDRPGDTRLDRCLGVNYDACHLAVEFEDASTSLDTLRRHCIRLSKFHFSSALRVQPAPESLAILQTFRDDVYLHQVITRSQDGALTRFTDLPLALASSDARSAVEWRIHYHIPLHASPEPPCQTTRSHLLDVMDWLARQPAACSHIEMETYTWEVLPAALKSRDVVQQLVEEYHWTLRAMAQRQLADLTPRSEQSA